MIANKFLVMIVLCSVVFSGDENVAAAVFSYVCVIESANAVHMIAFLCSRRAENGGGVDLEWK